jgi:hypothetical protein
MSLKVQPGVSRESSTGASILQDAYLGSHAMRATSSSMALAGIVLGFEIVELWWKQGDDKVHCMYVHATDEIVKKYPDLIVGHYPNHKKEHKQSPAVSFINS